MKKDKSKIIKEIMFILDSELKKINIISKPFPHLRYTLGDFIILVANEKTIGDFDYEKEKCYYVEINDNNLYFQDKDYHDTIENFVNKSLTNFLMVSIILKDFIFNMIEKNLFSKRQNDYLIYLLKQMNLRDFFKI
jgi:hypothetical protein